ncbi:MAG: GTPase ObgE [Candidatus Omnitrophica bacterium]|nr:GTPase ObgE [Candidatus Omnitrophota bacterium]
MLVDQVKIYVKAGSGGKGCRSFYRDKYTRQGIPDGGDGGNGADVIFQADRNLQTLLDFRYRRHFRGLDGAPGSGKKKKGKDAPDLIIRVPCGTIIRDAKTNCILRQLNNDGESVVVCRGGKGGRGNRHQRQETAGESGEEKEIRLDLKLIADVGIVGFPNAGKSTLLSCISNAHPKIAAYPFTTKSAVLGVVNSINHSFVVADIPGLIKGSSEGKGLGDTFLRHIERTKVLVHLIDMSGSEGRDPIEDYRTINEELKKYSYQLWRKPQILVANKMDLELAKENLERFKKTVKRKIYPISALKKEGLEGLIEAISRKL